MGRRRIGRKRRMATLSLTELREVEEQPTRSSSFHRMITYATWDIRRLLSLADILAVLYFHHMYIDPHSPKDGRT